MEVVYTDEALRDLDEIMTFIAANYPTISVSFETHFRAVVARVGRWPRSAQKVDRRPGVRVVPLVRCPYKIFYRVTAATVVILHIHHAARQQPFEAEL
jgi:toxin ParE1/3/4